VPSTALRKQLMKNVRRVVVKVGTAVLTPAQGQLDKVLIGRIARELAGLTQRGMKVTLVTSGAVGAGMGVAGLAARPRSLPMLQAAAAIGQPTLMALYTKVLARHKLLAGQLLVTRADFEHRTRYVNIRNTIDALHRLNAIAIINENDTTAVDELDRFADNDTIAALLTNLLRADLLVLLTVVDGVLNEAGQLIDLVPRVDERVFQYAQARRSALGSGGMVGKLRAAQMVTEAGEAVVIANGRKPKVLTRLLAGERIGTFFAPADRKMSARHRWIRSAVRPAGTVTLDPGAVNALLQEGKSLLARGITEVAGTFDRGDVVRLVAPDGRTIAHGISNYTSAELQQIRGLKSSEIADIIKTKKPTEVVHRDNLVLIAGTEPRPGPPHPG